MTEPSPNWLSQAVAALPDTWFATAFAWGGAAFTGIELVAVAVGLVMVVGNIRERLWAWPLGAFSSLLYIAIFARSKLYGEAALQVFFVVMCVWGAWQWIRGEGDASGSGHREALRVSQLTARGWLLALASAAGLWVVLGLLLCRITDTDVPWWDAFPTALSIVAQVLLGRKYIENWLGWLVVNVVSLSLYAYKGLWLTMGLYLVFAAMSVVGWRAWRQRLRP